MQLVLPVAKPPVLVTVTPVQLSTYKAAIAALVGTKAVFIGNSGPSTQLFTLVTFAGKVPAVINAGAVLSPPLTLNALVSVLPHKSLIV